MIRILSLICLILTYLSCSLIAQDVELFNNSDESFTKYLDSLKIHKATYFIQGDAEISYVDDFFQIIPLNKYANYNFNHLKFDGINLNSPFDKSFDYTLISFDEHLNFSGTSYLNQYNKIDNKNLQLQLVGGSIFGNANVFIQGKVNDLRIKTRNNYYVSNGFNNPKGSLYNPLSEITKQSFQSSLNLSLADSKTSLEYNQLILSNLSKNNYKESEYEFKDYKNFNSIFTLKYNSNNSDLVSTYGLIFLKYSNRLVNLNNINQYHKENELSYGITSGGYFKFIEEPTHFSLKYSQNNLDLTLLDKYYEFQTEDLIINLEQAFALYEDNLTNIAASINILNPIDKLNKIQYNKSVDYGFSFDYHHLNKTSGLINDLYFKIKYENEMPAFKYLFVYNLADDNSIPELNYQNSFTFGNKTTTQFLNSSVNFNVSYIRFNEYYFGETVWLSSKLNESWVMNVEFSFKYWLLTLDANFVLNLLGKKFTILDRINTLPSSLARLNLLARISENTILNITLINYEYNFAESTEIGQIVFPENSSLLNIKLEQNISNNINLFLSINNLLDEQIPLYPSYSKSGFNYLGGLQINF